jgi:hypothetical protein
LKPNPKMEMGIGYGRGNRLNTQRLDYALKMMIWG